MEKKKKNEGFAKIWRQSGPYLGLGSFLAISIAGGLLLGFWLDKKLGTEPWLMLVGIILGFIIGFYHFFKVVFDEGKKRNQ